MIWLINTYNGLKTNPSLLLRSEYYPAHYTHGARATPLGHLLKDRCSDPEAEKEERFGTLVEDEGCLLAVSYQEAYDLFGWLFWQILLGGGSPGGGVGPSQIKRSLESHEGAVQMN